MPGFATLRIAAPAEVRGSPEEHSTRGVSDHSPLVVTMVARRPRRSAFLVPHVVLRGEQFAERVSDFVAIVARAFEEVDPVSHWPEVKQAIRWVADAAREHVHDDALPAIDAADVVMRSVARAVLHNDRWLATKLQCQSALARRELVVGERVGLVDGAGFSRRFAEARAEAWRREAAAASGGRVGRGRRRAIQRLAALWAPRGKRIVLVGVAEAGEGAGEVVVHRSEEERLAALRRHWRPTFERAPTAEAAKKDWWAKHARRPVLDGLGPVLADFEGAVQRVRSSARGPDGLRYDAWRVAGSCALRSLCALLWHFLAGAEVPVDLAVALLVFLPKGELAGDEVQVVRESAATRPLGLMNIDSKLVQHVVNRGLTRHVAQHAHPAQRGFVAGRQLVANAVGLDGEMRCLAMCGDIRRLAVAVFFDLIAAFPSVDHGFLMSVTRDAGTPAGIVSFVHGLYSSATLVIEQDVGVVEFSG